MFHHSQEDVECFSPYIPRAHCSISSPNYLFHSKVSIFLVLIKRKIPPAQRLLLPRDTSLTNPHTHIKTHTVVRVCLIAVHQRRPHINPNVSFFDITHSTHTLYICIYIMHAYNARNQLIRYTIAHVYTTLVLFETSATNTHAITMRMRKPTKSLLNAFI